MENPPFWRCIFSIQDGDFPASYVCLPEGTFCFFRRHGMWIFWALSEAQILATLDHPNIVKCLSAEGNRMGGFRRVETSDYPQGGSKNMGTPKSSMLIGFSIINHPFWGTTIFGNTQLIPEKTNSQVIQVVTFWYPIVGGHLTFERVTDHYPKGTNRIANSMVHPNTFLVLTLEWRRIPREMCGKFGHDFFNFQLFLWVFWDPNSKSHHQDVIAFIFKLVECSNFAAACQHVMPGNFYHGVLGKL